MNNQLAVTGIDAKIMENVIMGGDLSKLNAEQKLSYYMSYCQRIGLDPITKPFSIIRLPDGKEIMYCDRAGSAQLVKKNSISHKITSREVVDGIYIVTALASSPDGQTTESIGAVSLEKEDGQWQESGNGKKFFKGNGKMIPLLGEARANAMMKAETKAKRRSTLDLVGLGIPDESEVGSIQGAQTVDVQHEEVKKALPEKGYNTLLSRISKAKNADEIKDQRDKTEALFVITDEQNEALNTAVQERLDYLKDNVEVA